MNPIAEMDRKLNNMILIGEIVEADHAAGNVIVKVGELDTVELPWPATIGKNFIAWRPLRIGTQVVLACPSGDIAQAVIISQLYSNDIARPSANENVDIITFDDGTTIQYDSDNSALNVNAVNELTINAQKFNLSANEININGADGDIVIKGISQVSHKHPQQNGNDNGGGVDTGNPK